MLLDIDTDDGFAKLDIFAFYSSLPIVTVFKGHH